MAVDFEELLLLLSCIPLVVEVYGGWGCGAQGCFSRLSKRLAMQVGVCETEALSQMYCLLGVTLMSRMQESFYSDVPKHPFRIVNLYCVMHVYVCLLVFSCIIISIIIIIN